MNFIAEIEKFNITIENKSKETLQAILEEKTKGLKEGTYVLREGKNRTKRTFAVQVVFDKGRMKNIFVDLI